MKVRDAYEFKNVVNQHAELMEAISWYANHAVEWSIRDEDDFDEFSDEILNILLRIS